MIALKRILLVEDKAKDVELALGALEEHHLANEVAVVRDGVEALDYLQARGKFAGRSGGDPAVVLLDIKMPRMGGLEVLRRVRADPRLKKVPIVVLTSSREEPDLTEAYERGVNAYVVKPVEFQQFTDAVKQVGAFWAILNEPPPHVGRKKTSGQNGGDISPGKNESQK
jgi:CheY-like chemotaxis protein